MTVTPKQGDAIHLSMDLLGDGWTGGFRGLACNRRPEPG